MGELLFQAMHRAAEAHAIRQEGLSALGEVLKWGIGKLGEHGTDLRTEDELKRLEPEIRRRMPKTGGVLVCIGLMEWESPDFMGDRAQTFLDISFAGSGPDAGTVLKQFNQTPRLEQRPPEGWRRKNTFMWVTSAEQHEEVKELRLH